MGEYVVVPRELLERYVSSVERHGYGFDGDEEIRTLLDKPALRQGEPVAWLIKWASDGSFYMFTQDRERSEKLRNDPEFVATPLYTHADPGEVERRVAECWGGLRAELAEVQRERETLRAELKESQDLHAKWRRRAIDSSLAHRETIDHQNDAIAQLAERDAHPLSALGKEAYSTLVGMVEFCLNQRTCMGMDEGFKSFEPEEEHDFVKELRSFVALSASAEPSAPADAVNFDLEAMKAAIQGPMTLMPDGISRVGFRAYMKESTPVERDERAAFEKTVIDKAERFQPELRQYGDHPDAEYRDANMQWAWELWQARAALERKP